MKVFISNYFLYEKFKDITDFCKSKDGEILFIGAFSYSYHDYMIGINSLNPCTLFTVKDLHIDKEFIYEILEDTYTEQKLYLGEGLVDLGIDYGHAKSNIFKRFDITCEIANKCSVNGLYKVIKNEIYQYTPKSINKL
jgi:hypothetical protein